MMRRDFLESSAMAAAGVLGPSLSSSASRKPNVLFILVDQLRSPCWTPELETPNMDRLASEGVSFENHFVSASVCSPSRACLLTGTHTTQNHILINCDFVNGDRQPSLDPSMPTIGALFRDAGYRTPYKGKWHLTLSKDRHPRDPLLDYGFELWQPPDAPFGGPPYSGAVQDPAYTRQAIKWLMDRDNHGQPWLLFCSLVNPHDICAYPRYYPQRKFRSIRTEAPPPNYDDDLSGKPGCQRDFQRLYHEVAGYLDPGDEEGWRRYLDYYIHCVEDMDGNLGRLLDALERSGQKDNTIIVFTSDHGDMGGSHGLRAKGCFAYDEIMRTPLIFSAPGMLAEGIQTESLASNVDVMPTLAALAGIDQGLPHIAGRDLTPVLANPEQASVRDEVIFHSHSELHTPKDVFTGREGNFRHPAHLQCIRAREWKYTYYFDPNSDAVDHELYNLADDPMEMDNLSADRGYRRKRDELHEQLMEEEKRLISEFEI